MSRPRFQLLPFALAALLVAGPGCRTVPPKDYTLLREHLPKSILVLPPLNESTAVEATYGYLAAVTRPLAELGYYVFPVAVVDQFLKENGLPTAGEMHQIPLKKVDEILGADSVLYLTVTQYGSKYQVVNSKTVVWAKAKLVDTRSGLLLWEGQGGAESNSGGSGNLIGDLITAAITQAVNSSTDQAHNVAPVATALLFTTKDQGLLIGPRHPEFGKPK
ncbi:MAG TPA: hypothetical protein DCM86_16720 [Verrucomicrobiales bacterium]|nr:hypothetical protein [Verrucomicrobiales bacterium]